MKRRFKQLLAMLLAATFLFSFPGCSGKPVKSSTSSVGDSSTTSTDANGNITVGTDASGNTVTQASTSGTSKATASGSSASSTGKPGSTTAKPNTQGGSGGSSTAKPVGNGKVVVWGSSSDVTLSLAVANYKKKYPSINIKLTPSPLGMTLNSLQMAIVAGNGPDVVLLDHVYATSMGTEGLFADLSQYGANNVKSLFTASCYNANCVGSKVYALPWSANVVSLMYSKEAFAKAGLSSPPTNYTEFVNDCKVLKNNGSMAFTFPCGDPGSDQNWSAFMFFTWLWREGGDILKTVNGKSVAAFNGPEGVAALNKLADLYKQGYIGSYTESMGSGGTSMLQMGTWKIDMVSGDNASKNGVALMPRLENNIPPYSGLGLYSYCVSAKSQDPQAAYNFVELLCTDKTLQLKYNKKDFITPLISAQSDSSYTTGTDAAAWKVFFQQLEYSKFRPGIPGWEDIEKVVSQGVYKVLKGNGNARDQLDAAANVVNNNLKRING